jgi:HmuY protein
MKFLRAQWIWMLVLALALGAVGCSEDDDNNDPAGPNTPGDQFMVDATDYENDAFFNLETGLAVAGDLAAADDWHVAFRRSEGKLNGGVSGNMDVVAANLAALDHEFGNDYESLVDMPTIEAEEWVEDNQRFVFDGWYVYDIQTHSVNPSNYVFIVKDAAGTGYAKVVVTDIVATGPNAIGSVDLQFVYNDAGTDLSGTEQTVTLTDDGDSNLYFSFANGDVDIADPASSSDWDIWFEGFTVHVNGGVSGPGLAGVFPAYGDPDYDEWSEVTTAPQNVGAGYEQDMITSVFTDWYIYNGQTHELQPSGDVYVIKVGETYYKFTVLSYYNEEDGTSGYINFRYAEL